MVQGQEWSRPRVGSLPIAEFKEQEPENSGRRAQMRVGREGPASQRQEFDPELTARGKFVLGSDFCLGKSGLVSLQDGWAETCRRRVPRPLQRPLREPSADSRSEQGSLCADTCVYVQPPDPPHSCVGIRLSLPWLPPGRQDLQEP